MDDKGYIAKAKYLRVVRGWRRATDERGLSDVERAKLNAAFLDYVLVELMPWHKNAESDFSHQEVNR